MPKERFWKQFSSYEEASKAWDRGAEEATKQHPLKVLKTLPKMPGISKEAASFLKLKSLWWMIKKDTGLRVMRHILRHPFSFGWRYIRSIVRGKSYVRDDDFFFYGVSNEEEFKALVNQPDTLLVVGFSYCEKPHECPVNRFTPECIHDPEHPVCRQCFIGKTINMLPENQTIPLIIPTIHYIGEQIFKIIEANPGKKVLFFITACEMTLEMFGDWGMAAGIKGIGVRLDGRICNTMKAFELSEVGIKPGLTVVLPKTQERILQLLTQVQRVVL